MHPHLHTKDNIGEPPLPRKGNLLPRSLLMYASRAACEEVMIALEECHARGFLWKSMGMCSGAKDQVSKCLRAERLKMQQKNRTTAQDQDARIRAQWKDIDANS